MSTTLIGRNVRVASSEFRLSESGPATLAYRLPADADSLTASVFDEEGRLVATIHDLEKETGDHTFEWDGRDTNGDRVSPGMYSFQVLAADASGGTLEAEELLVGHVDGVRYRDGAAWLVIGNHESLMSDVFEVNDEG